MSNLNEKTFSPLTEEEIKSSADIIKFKSADPIESEDPAGNGFKPILPPPDGASAPDLVHSKFGMAIHRWKYINSLGCVEGYVCLYGYPDEDGIYQKSYLPLRYGIKNGIEDWHIVGWKDGRPLYNGHLIQSRPGDPILVVEGEKAADKAAELFPEYVVVTSMGGASSAHCTDWIHVKNRHVVIWPDKDDAGLHYSNQVADLAIQAGASSVKIVDVPDKFPVSWDLADELPDGFDINCINDLLISAKEAMPTTLDRWMDYLNRRLAVVMRGSSCRILNEGMNPYSGDLQFGFSSEKDILLRYRHIKFEVGEYANGKPKRVSVAKIWLDHPDRRQFEGVVFSPDKEIPGYFNLWRGFAFEPVEGECELYLAHLKHVVCSGKDTLYSWLLGWMADLVQNPANRPGTAIVLRGKQGTGKTLAFSLFGSLFGTHFGTISQGRHLIGNFNSHLDAKILVLAEEAFWAGDKQAEGVLKDLVTGDTINIEQKGVDVQQSRNLIRLMITSNHEWIVPAGMEERRFAVFDVSDDHMQDKPYFKAIVNEMDNGGREALLYHLMHHDYSADELRTIPQTDALWDQKYRSLDAAGKFWFEVLSNGTLTDDDDSWPEFIRISQFMRLYYDAATKAGQKHKGWETEVGIRMRQLCPDMQRKRKVLPILDKDGKSCLPKVQQNVYIFPDLITCRELFDEATSSENPWPEFDEE